MGMKQPRIITDALRLLSVCPLCQEKYNPLEARILEEGKDSQLLHIQCRNCANALLALVQVSPGGVSSLGMITDLTFDDAVRFQEGGSVDADDVLAGHLLLQDNAAFRAALV